MAALGVTPHFGLEADVWCPDAPPPSCVLDGIQISTGCTMGKRNIRHHVAEGVTVKVRGRKTGRSLSMIVRQETIARAVEVMRRENDEAGAAVIRQVPLEELVEITLEQ